MRGQRPLVGLAERVARLVQKSGKAFAIAYLKQSWIDTVHYLAGTPRKGWSGSGPIVRLDHDGLPIIIPPTLRTFIKDRDVVTIKLVLTILGFYRVLKIAGKLDTSTITDPGVNLVCNAEFKQVWSSLVAKNSLRWPAKFSWSYLVTSGPNSSRSIASASVDAVAFLIRPRLLSYFVRLAPGWVSIYLVSLGVISLVFHLLWIIPRSLVIELIYNPTPTVRRPSLRVSPVGWLKSMIPLLGRLSVKHEAAGKERIFAITDWWTQCLLKPLHQSVFRFLRTIPQDGTFDQLAPVRRLLDTARLGMKVFSFDLSSATDRFPLALQIEVLSHHIGPYRARLWGDLLTKRSWVLHGISGSEPLRYAVGQPMGAYSSWAVFALTHHAMVQVAAARTGHVGWYPHYALLGDDIVIAGEEVANAYLALARQIGVDISMAKSLVSDGGLVEFAKHLLTPYRDYSPIGTKALLGCFREGLYLPSYAQDLSDKQFPILPHQVFADFQSLLPFRKGAKAVANHYRGISAVFGPGGAYSLPLADWMFNTINPVGFREWLPPGDVLSLLYAISSIVQVKRDNLQAAIGQNSKEFWSRWYLGLDIGLPGVLSFIVPRFWVKALELLELESQEYPGYSTFELRQRVHEGDIIHMSDILQALRGPEYVRGTVIIPDRGSLQSSDWALVSRKMAKLAEQLRQRTMTNRSNYRSQGQSRVDFSLVIRETWIPDISTFCYVDRWEHAPGMPWFISYDLTQVTDRKVRSRLTRRLSQTRIFEH